MKKWMTISAVAIAAIIIVSIVYENVSSPPVGVNHGMAAPEFSLELADGDGEEMSLSDQQGNLVILNLWASWCEPCVDELPLLSDLHETYKDEGVVVLANNLTTRERQIENAFEFLQEHPVEMPVLMDYDGDFLDMYPLQGLPTTYVIDEDGIIADIIVGEVDEQIIEARVMPHIEEKMAADA